MYDTLYSQQPYTFTGNNTKISKFNFNKREIKNNKRCRQG